MMTVVTVESNRNEENVVNVAVFATGWEKEKNKKK